MGVRCLDVVLGVAEVSQGLTSRAARERPEDGHVLHCSVPILLQNPPKNITKK